MYVLPILFRKIYRTLQLHVQWMPRAVNLYSTVCIVRCLFMIWKSKLPFTICTKCFFTCFNLIFRLDIHLYSKKYTVCRTNNTTVTTLHVQCTVYVQGCGCYSPRLYCKYIGISFLTPLRQPQSQAKNFLLNQILGSNNSSFKKKYCVEEKEDDYSYDSMNTRMNASLIYDW